MIKQCVAGCQAFTGREVKHHKDCPWYKESLTKCFENQIEKLEKRLANLPSEEEIGLLLYMTWNRFTYKVAKEHWTGKHIKTATKTVSARLAKAIHKRIRGE